MSVLAAWVDARGLVSQVLQNDFALLRPLAPGAPLRGAFDPMSRRKLDRMLAAVREQGVALDWQLNLGLEGEVAEVVATGGGGGDGRILVICSDAAAGDADHLYEELLRVNSDQATELRSALKELSAVRAARGERAGLSMAEFTRLNNELVNVQRELAQRNSELERLDDQKNRFLGMAAHELRNPLGAIAGFAKLMLAGLAGEVTDEQREMLERIQRSSDGMLALVNDLLDHAKIESGKLELNVHANDPVALSEGVLALHRPYARGKQIVLALEAGSDAPRQAWLDADKVEQVLSNLVSNAIKYSPSGSIVTLRVRPGREDEVCVEVADQGPGIPAPELRSLFQPFHVTSVKATGGEKSTGLGLFIVKRIVEGHGGRIRVASEVGAGSTFAIDLPLDARERARPSSAGELPQEPPGPG